MWKSLNVASVVVALFLGMVPSSASGQVTTPPAPYANFRFNGNDKNSAKGDATLELRNTQFKENAIYLNGKYDGAEKDGYRAVCKTPRIDYTKFTVAIRFKAEEFNPNMNNLITGGTSYRWFGMNRSQAGNLVITLNNQAFSHEIKDASLEAGKWTVVACAVDLSTRKVTAHVNGKIAAEIDLPSDFQLEVMNSTAKESDKAWTFSNYSNGSVFHGLVDRLLIYDRALGAGELEKINLK